MCCYCLLAESCLTLFATPCTVAHQAPLSTGFPRQEYWSRLLFASLGDLPHQGSNSRFLLWWADSLPLSYLESPTDKKENALILERKK